MFKEKTVFVLGAGSSAEFNMPVGLELKRTIASKLDFQDIDFGKPKRGDQVLFEALLKMEYSGTLDTTRYFLEAIDTYDSIDEFLASDPHNEEFQKSGKMAIVKSILEAENESSLGFSTDFDLPKDNSFLSDDEGVRTYIGPLIKRLRSGVTVHNLKEIFNNVTFINFNYDRCLERALTIGLSCAYPSEPDEVSEEWVKNAKILRPYGSVGSYWKDDDNFVPFGGPRLNVNDYAEKLIDMAEDIYTFSENDSEFDNLLMIKEEILSARNIVFLGLHFHKQNLDLVNPEYERRRNVNRIKKVLATAYNRSESDRENLLNILSKLSINTVRDNHVILEAGTCYELFHNNQLAF